MIPNLRSKDNSTGQQTRNLLKHNSLPVTLYSDSILLVLVGAIRAAGIKKLPPLVANIPNYSGNRRPVHVHIEYAEKNANALLLAIFGVYDGNVSNLSVCRRNQRAGLLRNDPFGIPKEPEEEKGKQNRQDSPRGPGQPAEQTRCGDERQTVIVTVTNHGGFFYYSRPRLDTTPHRAVSINKKRRFNRASGR